LSTWRDLIYDNTELRDTRVTTSLSRPWVMSTTLPLNEKFLRALESYARLTKKVKTRWKTAKNSFSDWQVGVNNLAAYSTSVVRVDSGYANFTHDSTELFLLLFSFFFFVSMQTTLSSTSVEKPVLRRDFLWKNNSHIIKG